jgi:hypothetical protein
LEQVHGEAPRVLKSHIEIGESSRAKHRVTTRILLNKWQRQLEKEGYQKRKHEEERRRAEEEACRRDLEQYTREQERAHGVRILQALLERGVEASYAEKLPGVQR